MQIRTATELGALVKARRHVLGWSQQQLADETGVKRLWIVQFEAGKNTAHIGLVFRTLRTLNIVLEVGSKSEPEAASEGVDLDAILGEAD